MSVAQLLTVAWKSVPIVVVAGIVAAFAPRQIEPGMTTGLVLGAICLCVMGGLLLLWRSRTRVEQWVIVTVGVLAAASFWSSLPPGGWVSIWPFIALAAAVALCQQRWPVLQYMFFCRFPLLVALALVFFPLIALVGLPMLFRTMFILGWGGLAFVTLLTVVCASVVLATGGLILRHAHLRFPVPRGTRAAHWVTRHRRWIAAVLALPVIATTFALSEASWLGASLGVVVGIIQAGAIVWLAERASDWLTPPDDPVWRLADENDGRRLAIGSIAQKARSAEVPCTRTARRVFRDQAKASWLDAGYVADGVLLPGYLAAFALMGATLVLYWAGYWLLKPNGLVQAPPLSFVIFLLIMLGWILPTISFLADRFRVPTVLALAVLPFVLYFINDIDHYYEPYALPAVNAAVTSSSGRGELRTAFDARLARSLQMHPDGEPVIIGVAAGGGGGSAAYWTARVLAGLQGEFTERLTDSIHLISGVSGGSVGAMYFVSAFEPPSAEVPQALAPSTDRLEEVVTTTGTSSLAAAAWGLAYPDFFRLLSLRSRDVYVDRGWALEQAWNELLGKDRGRRLSDWRDGTLRGWRPTIFFNATVSETGERLVISPLRVADLDTKCRDEASAVAAACEDQVDARTLRGLYPAGGDLRLVTAARLSATFPFVMPIPKSRAGPDGFHVADGGYYDNDGVLSFVEWARKALAFSRDTPARRLLLVDVRLTQPAEIPRARAGWVYSTIGPIVTMVSARGSSQVLRNNVDFKLLADTRQAGEFKIVRAEFPLSLQTSRAWHLPQAEKDEIDAYWHEDEGVAAARGKIKAFLCEAKWRLTCEGGGVAQ